MLLCLQMANPHLFRKNILPHLIVIPQIHFPMLMANQRNLTAKLSMILRLNQPTCTAKMNQQKAPQVVQQGKQHLKAHQRNIQIIISERALKRTLKLRGMLGCHMPTFFLVISSFEPLYLSIYYLFRDLIICGHWTEALMNRPGVPLTIMKI